VIFQRNVQLEKDKNQKRGLGLGLSIVKKIADAHHAKVGVEPNPEGGNVFYILFPRTKVKSDKGNS
jgi:two-component system phosphate regulon sensor histidine kinase PhoR